MNYQKYTIKKKVSILHKSSVTLYYKEMKEDCAKFDGLLDRLRLLLPPPEPVDASPRFVSFLHQFRIDNDISHSSQGQEVGRS